METDHVCPDAAPRPHLGPSPGHPGSLAPTTLLCQPRLRLLDSHQCTEDAAGKPPAPQYFPFVRCQVGSKDIVSMWVFPVLLFGNQTITCCFPYAIYMKSTDFSQKFSRCLSLSKHGVLNLTFLLKQSTGSRQSHFWFHPWNLLIL